MAASRKVTTAQDSVIRTVIRHYPIDVPSFSISRAVFLRLLGAVYLIAFASLTVQVTGLVGENGLMPVGEFLSRAHEVYGSSAYRLFPTLAWLSPTGAFLTLLSWTGVALSIVLVLGIVPVLTTTLLWALYLALTIAYAAVYITIILAMSVFVFSRRDFK